MRLPSCTHALLLAHAPLHARQRARSPPAAFEDGAIVFAAAALATAAGALQYSVSAGDKGISAFLGKEKSVNPFYSSDFTPDLPTAPAWLKRLRPPPPPWRNDGDPGEGSSMQPGGPPRDVNSLYTALDEAIEREDYVAAAEYKRQIDLLLQDKTM